MIKKSKKIRNILYFKFKQTLLVDEINKKQSKTKGKKLKN